jgi:hypothetical protein
MAENNAQLLDHTSGLAQESKEEFMQMTFDEFPKNLYGGRTKRLYMSQEKQ